MVVQAIWSLAPMAARTNVLRLLAVLAALLAALAVNELTILFGTGMVAVLTARHRGSRAKPDHEVHRLAPAVPLALAWPVFGGVTLPGPLDPLARELDLARAGRRSGRLATARARFCLTHVRAWRLQILRRESLDGFSEPLTASRNESSHSLRTTGNA